MKNLIARLKKEETKYLDTLSLIENLDCGKYTEIINFIDDNYELNIYKPNDNWDDSLIGFKIPDFKVMNSNGAFTMISDFVICPYRIIGCNIRLINALHFRESLYDNQLLNYDIFVHPHVQTHFNHLCVGTDYSLLNAFSVNKDKYQYEIITYIEKLKWESLGGRPYHRILKINNPINSTIIPIDINPTNLKLKNGIIEVKFEDSLFYEMLQINEDEINEDKRIEGLTYIKNGILQNVELKQYPIKININQLKKRINEKYYEEKIYDQLSNKI